MLTAFHDDQPIREFKSTDFTRAWRTMRCWAWRNKYWVITGKEQARQTSRVDLDKIL